MKKMIIGIAADHGSAGKRLEGKSALASHVLAKLKEIGIDTDSITQELEGIVKFNKSFDQLIQTIETEKKLPID